MVWTIGAVLAGALAAVAPPTPEGVAAFVRDKHLTRYRIALSDLNDDGRPEALVYALADDEAVAQGNEANRLRADFGSVVIAKDPPVLPSN